jgi:hypothetical protein
MFLAGILIGAFGSAFYYGMRSGEPDRLGGGLNQLLEAPRIDIRSPVTEPPVTDLEPARATFEFFTVLPEFEQLIPEATDAIHSILEDDGIRAKEGVVEPKDSGSYYMLQVASYTTEAEADHMKLELSKAGFSSSIQHISIQNRGDFYRVRLGPIFTMPELEKVDVQLNRIGIAALRLKVSRP